jgi:two-component system phosphate regulon sensor histidine kinase PhoR
MWLALTIVALAALAVLHLWWRARFARAETGLRAEIAALKEEELRRSVHLQAEQEALFNSMAEGLVVLDESGRIQLANPAFAELLEVTGSICGKTIMEALRMHDLAALVERLPTEGKVLEEELRLPGLDERWIEVNAVALTNRDGRPPRAILVFHDLTRIKKLERTREEFVANVSHELRTPLSLIKGYAETLLDGAKDNPEVATKFIQTIDRNSERLRLLIEDLLTISELESGRVRLSLQRVAVRPLIEKVFADFRSRANARGVTLMNEAPESAARADAGRLDQVLCNLIENAIKYGREGGHVTVGAHARENDYLEIFVRDDGPGIPSDAIDRVFERFYRVDKARSREQGGTGLGLAIVKHIVLSHGGKVWAESEPGKGATFFFTIPKERQEELFASKQT